MKKWIVSAAVSMALSAVVAVHAEEAKNAPAADNPVKVEMRLLNDAFKNLLDSLILNNPGAIEEPFHEVHRAKANTEKALEKGEIKLPKNSNKMKEFIHMDEQFHGKLEALIEASRKGDMKAVQDVTHKLLNGCVQCHNKFRN
ncbi:MAG: hypothetical protein AABY54_03285 [Deltaproteobacteria bacterium]